MILKKILCLVLAAASMIFAFAVCANNNMEDSASVLSANPQQTKNKTMLANKNNPIRIRLTFDGGEAIVRLENNAAAKDFAAKLPLTQTFKDFNRIEKICRLPEKIKTEGMKTGADPRIADVTLYIPWNTLVFYYDDYGYNKDLVPIGHVESGMDALSKMGDEFTVTMCLLEEPASNNEQTALSENTRITMTIGDTVITAMLDDSDTAQEFLATLPRTLAMKQYGNREYYGRIEKLSENDEVIDDFKNGDITYYPAGPSFAIFYAGENSSSQKGLLRIGKITSDLSAFNTFHESVDVRIEVEK